MSTLDEIVTRIHGSPARCVLYLTGGGSLVVAQLLGVPGASRTVLEVMVPYSRRALSELLGTDPPQALCAAVAAQLADRAYRRALHLDDEAGPVFGLGATAGLATDRIRRGPHRCFVGVTGNHGRRVRALTLHKGQRTRPEEEQVVARLILTTLAEACGIATDLDPLLLPDERVEDVPADA